MHPHVDPTQIFGKDLILVFGPKAKRRHVSTLTPAEKQAILAKVPVYVETDDCSSDNRPSIFQVTNKVLTILQQTGALMGVDLDWCDDLRKGKLVRHSSAYIDVSLCYKNNDVQRGIWLRHLIMDILFSFNPTNVLSGLARKLNDGTYNLNNGQHRTVACVIVGVREIPLEYIVSDLISVDVDEYATDNLDTLSSSEFDHYRIRVWRNKIRKSEGRKDLEPQDIKMEAIHDLHASKRSRFVEKGTENPKPLECTGVGNMIKYHDRYGHDIYAKALDIVTTVWYKSPISTANCWGIMEFLETQLNGKGHKDDMFIYAVQSAIAQRYSDPSKSGMHREIKNVVKYNSVFKELDLPEPKVIAAGIYKIVKTYNPGFDLEPIKYNGKDMTKEYMDGFRVMPLKQAA